MNKPQRACFLLVIVGLLLMIRVLINVGGKGWIIIGICAASAVVLGVASVRSSSRIARICCSFVACGCFFQALVMGLNGGKMPVEGITQPYQVWIPITGDTKLVELSDVLWKFSLGDFAILGGLTVWIISDAWRKSG